MNLLHPKLGWHALYIIPLVLVAAAIMVLKKGVNGAWKALTKNRSAEHDRLRILAGITPSKKPSDTVRYNITNSGSLEIDAEALVNSDGWKRQVAAVKRLKDIQNVNDSIVKYNITDSRCRKDDSVKYIQDIPDNYANIDSLIERRKRDGQSNAVMLVYSGYADAVLRHLTNNGYIANEIDRRESSLDICLTAIEIKWSVEK